jgi:hypothetical protein
MNVNIFSNGGGRSFATHYAVIAFLSVSWLLPTEASPEKGSGGNSESSRVNTNKSSNQSNLENGAVKSHGGSNVMVLSEAEKSIAKSLRYNENVLKLLKSELNAQFSIKLPAAIDPDASYGSPYHMGELLPQDIANYRQIAKDYPEFASIVGWEIERFDPSRAGIQKQLDETSLKRLGKDKFARSKRIMEARSPYSLLIRQEELERDANKLKTDSDYLSVPVNAVDSDEATEAYIAKIKSHFAGMKLKNEHNLKPFLQIKYWGAKGSTNYSDPRIADLRVKLQGLGYRITEETRGEEDRRTFVHRVDAIKLLDQTGTRIDKLSLNEQHAMKFPAIYPIQLNDWRSPENAKILTVQSMPDLLQNAPAGSLEETIKLNQAAAVAAIGAGPQLKRHGFAMREVTIPPGSKITKLGNRRWMIECPERYTATTHTHVATIVKVAKDDVGLELIRTQETDGTNYSVTNQMIQDKVSDWNTRYGVVVTEADRNTVTLQFKKLPDDLRSLCAEIFLFSPCSMQLFKDEIGNLAEMRKFATHLRNTKELTLYWD